MKGSGKGKGDRKPLDCHNCGGDGHPKRLCPSPENAKDGPDGPDARVKDTLLKIAPVTVEESSLHLLKAVKGKAKMSKAGARVHGKVARVRVARASTFTEKGQVECRHSIRGVSGTVQRNGISGISNKNRTLRSNRLTRINSNNNRVRQQWLQQSQEEQGKQGEQLGHG